ncbi:MAG: class II glutamine amidotransferase [Clostridiales bacterium]|nr:class II glutamine amidotransferase [Clostridiales bacterium]
MCELFGVYSKKNIHLNNLLEIFYSHGEKHPHGWGLSYFNENGDNKFYKESSNATKCPILHSILSSPLYGNSALGHIRYASVGNIAKVNAHPFIGEDILNNKWTLIHNGTIFSGMELLKYTKTQKGETDSERILLFLLDEINKAIKEKGRSLTNFERFKVVEMVIEKLAYRNKLNLLIFDGTYYYAHTNEKDTLYFSKNDDSIYFSTTKLTEDIIWNNLPINKLHVFSEDIKEVYTGSDHGFEYIKSKPGEHDKFYI